MRTRFIFGAVLLSWLLSNLDMSGGTIFSLNGLSFTPAVAGLFSASSTQVQSNTPNQATVTLDLGQLPDIITTLANEMTVITVNATCSVGGIGNTRVDIDIMVDGVVVSPTDGTRNILCSGNGTFTPNDGQIGGTVIGQVEIATPGMHTVEIIATAIPSQPTMPIPRFRIGPLTVVVQTAAP
jgi:hypothetical protein